MSVLIIIMTLSGAAANISSGCSAVNGGGLNFTVPDGGFGGVEGVELPFNGGDILNASITVNQPQTMFAKFVMGLTSEFLIFLQPGVYELNIQIPQGTTEVFDSIEGNHNLWIANGAIQVDVTCTPNPNPLPTITAINPTGGTVLGGTAVTITGTNFTGTTAVTFEGFPATNVTVVNDTTITATTPATGDPRPFFRVDVGVGTAIGSNIYTYFWPAPTVTAINPTSGTTLGGTAVTITGTNFSLLQRHRRP
jgi:IPT/TIG domain